MKKITLYSIVSLGVVAIGSVALARPPLSSDARITNELTVAAVADEIRHNCPNISARMSAALSKAMALRNYAMGLGYSAEEIKDFLNDKSEQNRIYSLRDNYLTEHGVKKGDAASYCTLGDSEINAGSLLGSILRSH